jgi:hypothetical protein
MMGVNTAHYGCRLSHQQRPGPLRQYERWRCLHLEQRFYVAHQVLFIHDARHSDADGVKVGVVYE